MSLPNELHPLQLAASSGGYEIEQSLRFNSADSYTFRRTPSSDSTSQKKFTVSAWVKRGVIASGTTGGSGRQGIFYTGLANGSGNLFGLEWNDDGLACIFNGAGTIWPKTDAKFRDPSAWYHVVAAVDTAQATTADRLKLYVNGVEQTLTGTLPTLDFLVTNGTTSIHSAGENAGTLSNEYLAEVYYINDQQLTPSDFAEENTDGVWIPKEYAGTFTGTNSCYLTFDPSATNGIGHDHSGNGNNFTPSVSFNTSGTGTDVFSDTPTTNWATLNPLWNPIQATYAEGNLQFTGGATHSPSVSSISASSGKYYFEATALSGSLTKWSLGIIDTAITYRKISGTNYIPGYVPSGIYSPGDAISLYDNNIYKNGSIVVSNPFSGGAIAAGDVVQMAVDIDAGKIWFGIDGTWNNGGGTEGAFNPSGHDATFAANDDYIFHFTAENCGWTVNFGQRDFEQTVPTGFKPLNTANLPAPDIADGSQYFAPLVGPGDTETAWSETNTAVSVSGGQLTTYDGLANTEYLLRLTDTKYPPIDFIRSLRELELDGYDDWYLGSQYEMEVVYYNLKPTTENNATVSSGQDNAYSVPQRTTLNYTTTVPAQTSVTAFQAGGAQAFDSETSTAQMYYTSSAGSTNASNGKSFTDQGLDAGYKVANQQKYSEVGITRAMRRVAYTGSEPSIGSAYEGGYYAGLYSLNGDGTATHALIVSDKANGENTGMKALVQQKFSSGLYWIKDRQASASHKLIDSVRGLTNQLSSDSTDAETTYSDADNASVAWNWLAGGSSSSISAGSIDGTNPTIASTVSANPSAGFSIGTYTADGSNANRTVGHGLGVPPEFIIVKNRDTTGRHWLIWHKGLNDNDKAFLFTSDAAADNRFGPSAPTSTVFGLYGGQGNYNSDDHVFYAFAGIEGYSKFGTYDGNNNPDGPFVFCGFKPAVLIVKANINGSAWGILDSARNPYNTGASNKLYPSGSAQETGDETVFGVDFFSNGFKPRTASGDFNESGRTFMFAAFASNPFGGSGVSPVTAR